MRRVPLVTVMVLLVGAVMGLSLWMTRRAGQEAVGEFRLARSQEASQAGSALAGFLESFDRDARLLATLALGTRRQGTSATEQDHEILTALRALAVVVPHYRTLARAPKG